MVDTPDGRLGYVEEVVCDPDTEEPLEIVVRGGDLGVSVFHVPVEKIAVVQPERERVALESAPASARLSGEIRTDIERDLIESVRRSAR
jgi:hypothetical protein